MSIRAVIIDDEQTAINMLLAEAEKLPSLEIVHTATKYKQAFDYISNNQVDLLFLDYHMEPLTGVEILQHLNLPTLFVTAHKDFFMEAMDHVNAIDYLVKPIRTDRFITAMRKVERVLRPEGGEGVSLLSQGGYLNEFKSGKKTIPQDEVQYISAESGYIWITTEEGRFITPISLNSFEEILDPEKFVRIHKSIIVSRTHVKRKTFAGVILRNEKELNIGRQYRGRI